LQGAKANIIREVNTKAIPQYSSGDVQILSWSIQNGLSYDEMTKTSREIIDKVVPELKSQLRESFLENFSEKWNQLSKATNGVLPGFGETSDTLLSNWTNWDQSLLKCASFGKDKSFWK